MVMRIIDLVRACYTSSDGDVVREALLFHIRGNRSVVVSFAGIDTVTSSFVNSALVPLLDTMPLEEFKRRLRFVEVTHQIGDLIRSRLTQASKRQHAAA
jgi:hypothetical protein